MSTLPSSLLYISQQRKLIMIKFQRLIDLVSKFGCKHFWNFGKDVWIAQVSIKVFVLKTYPKVKQWHRFCRKVRLFGSDFVWRDGSLILKHRGVWSSYQPKGSLNYADLQFRRVKWRRKATALLLLNVSWFNESK